MKITCKEVNYTGKFLRFITKYFENDTGTGIWESVERTAANKDAIVIIAITKEDELILERNWRIPVESYIIQLPAGLNDKEGESEEDVARRELLEETGYLAKNLEFIMKAPESPGLLATSLSHYLARDVEYTGKAKRDAAEQIEVIKIPLSKVGDFLLNPPPDTSIDLRVPGILWYLEKKQVIGL